MNAQLQCHQMLKCMLCVGCMVDTGSCSFMDPRGGAPCVDAGNSCKGCSSGHSAGALSLMAVDWQACPRALLCW